MTEEELERLAEKVSDRMIQDQHTHNINPDTEMLKVVAAILKGFGMRTEDEEALSADFRYLRNWRLGAEKVQGVGITALVTILVGGVLSALWIGVKAMVGK